MDIVKKEEKSLDEHIFNTKMNLYLNNAGKNHSFLNLIKNDKYLFINFQKEDYYFMGPNILYNNQINNYKNPFVGYILDLKKKYLENKYELFKDKKLKFYVIIIMICFYVELIIFILIIIIIQFPLKPN